MERCPVCGRETDPGCACLGARDREADPPALALQRDVARRLVRAWLSLGTGGLLLFISAIFLAGNLHPLPTTAIGVAAIGAALALRGSRVVKQTERDLLVAAANHALPPARIVP
jgi:hypothetical protein